MIFRHFAGHILLLIMVALLACTTEKIVYVLPDGTEVTPTAAQATQAAGGGSQATASQPASASQQSTPTSAGSAPKNVAESGESQPPQAATATNPRWNDKRNTLCSSLGLDASLCENIALNQTEPEGEIQPIELPDEPDATPVPVDDIGAAAEELNEIVQSESEVSIHVLTYTENLISQAAVAS